jgi:hypothetical protein
VIDRIEWAKMERTEIDRVMNRKEIAGQLGDSRSSDVETGWFRANGSSIVALAGEALDVL